MVPRTTARRRDAALPRSSFRGLALDRRDLARAGVPGAGAAALEWIDRTATSTATASSRARKRSERGLDVQSWKDSFDSQRFHDGRTADRRSRPPRRRATSTTRSAAWPRSRARSGAGLRPLAERLDREADELSAVRRGVLVRGPRRLLRARARRRQEQQVDSILLEHRPPPLVEIVPGARRGDRRRAHGEGLWSGWGVRTMSGDEPRRPALYHNGTVWPHDKSLDAPGGSRSTTAGRGAADRPADAGGVAALRTISCPRSSPACAGPRRRFPSPIRPPRAAGVGGRDARAPAPGSARPSARPARHRLESVARSSCRTGPARSGSRASRLRRDVGRARREGTVQVEAYEDRCHSARLVPRAADGLRRHRVGRVAARRRARRRGHDVTLFALVTCTRSRSAAIRLVAPSEWIGRSLWEWRHVLSSRTSARATSTSDPTTTGVRCRCARRLRSTVAGRPHRARPSSASRASSTTRSCASRRPRA